MMIQKKIGRYIGIRVGIAMSITMSLVGSLLGAITAVKSSGAPFIAAFLPSLLASIIITTMIAIGLTFIIPMKKINDGVEKATKTKGFALHFLQSFVSDLIYTPIIGIVMAFFTTAVFVIPKSPDLSMNMLIPVALGNFAKSFLPEFMIALVVVIVIEPIIQKAAFKKFIPNYGQCVKGHENIETE